MCVDDATAKKDPVVDLRLDAGINIRKDIKVLTFIFYVMN